MKDDSMKIEQRLQNMKNFYTKVGDLLDNLPDAIPEKARQKIRDTILGDEELKNLMDGVDSHRPPRIFLIGRTGVGKSSLKLHGDSSDLPMQGWRAHSNGDSRYTRHCRK